MTEVEIRKHLVKRLARRPEGIGAAFISELFLDSFSRRADLVMANGKLSAFEIKSPRDSLDRLDGQLGVYRKFFEEVTIVCAAKHVTAVLHIAPVSIGVWCIDETGKLETIREPRTQRVSSKRSWLSFLPVDEIRNLLRIHEMPCSGSRPSLLEASQAVSLTKIRAYVLAYLKRRHHRVEALRKKRRAQQVTAIYDGCARLSEFLQDPLFSGPMKAIPRRV